MQTSPAATARRFLRWEYAPEAVLLAGLAVFLLDQTDAATSAFKSTKALVIMGAAAAGWLGARLLLAHLVPFPLARAGVFSVAAAVALAVVVLPAYDNETVIESFPTAVAAPAEPPALPARPSAPGLDPAAASPGTSPSTVSADKIATPPPAPVTTATATAPATPAAATATVPPAEPSTATSTATVPADPPGDAPASSAASSAPAGPQRLRSGSIRGIDHRASGTAVIYRQPDGRYVVGLEDIDIQPGPDYDLYVVPGENREDIKDGIRLGDLRGNRGTQYYEVPDGANLDDGAWTVLVWCQTFAVPVAGATPN